MKRYLTKKSGKKMAGMIAIFLSCAIFLNNAGIYSVLAAENAPGGNTGSSRSQETLSAFSQNETPPEGGDGSTSQPPEGGGSETPPPEGGDGSETPPPEGGGGSETPPPEGGDGSETPPPEGGDGSETPPPEGGDGSETPPPEGGDGSETPPPEGGDGNTEQPPEEGDGTGGEPPQDIPFEDIPPEDGDILDQLPPDGEEPPVDGSLDEEITEDGNEENWEDLYCLEGKEHEYEEILAEDGTVTKYRCVFCLREITEETLEAEGGSLHGHLWNRAEGEIIPVCESCGLARLDCEGEDGYGIHIFEWMPEEGEAGKYRCAVCGAEKEFLDEWDMTVELFAEIMGVSMYAVTYTYKNGETSEIPINQLQLASYTGKKFTVKNLADLMALQELSNDGAGFDFDGYTIEFHFRKMADGSDGPDNGTKWDLTELKGDFNGLGSENAPFKGTLTLSYDSASLHFLTATPLLNYAATGAVVSGFQINANIEGDGSSPVGAVAAHVVRSDKGDTLTVSDISLSGSVSNPGGTAGGLFGEVTTAGGDPIKIRYEKNDGSLLGVSVKTDVSGACAGGLAGRTEGAVEVYKTDMFPTGGVSGTQYAGMLVGNMEAGGTLFAAGTDGSAGAAGSAEECAVRVSGSGTNGGLIGRIANGTVCRVEGNDKKLILTGSVEGGNAGGLVGECVDSKIRLNHIAVNASVTANAGNAGGLVGSFSESRTGNANAAEGDWHILHHIDVNGDVKGMSQIGGIVGYLRACNFRIGQPGEADNFDCMKVLGNIAAGNPGAAAGGMIGTAEGEFIEVYHVTTGQGNNEIRGAGSIGGVIGKVGSDAGGAVVKVKNAKIASSFSPEGNNKIQGGIFGDIHAGSMAAMDGTIDVAALGINDSSLLRGHIAGQQKEALVYFEENCRYQRPEGKAWVDDIGNYGGVYRNGTWGEDGNPPLISYGEKKIQGVVGNSGSGWILDSEADVIRLAIALNTEGRFAGNCFGNTGKAGLLGADYLLKKADYALGNSGIYALNRNDRGNEAGERFSGKLAGGGMAVIDLGDCITYQSFLSLFPCAGEGAEFKNLTVKRNIKYAKNAAAGLAAYASGNVTVDHVDMRVSLTGSADNETNPGYLYGGMFANYRAGGAVTLSITGSRIGGSFEVIQNTNDLNRKQYIGGAIAKYAADSPEIPVIKIDGLEIAAQITSGSRFTSGMITQINMENAAQDRSRDRVTLDMKNIEITKDTRIHITDVGETGGLLGWKWFGIAPCAGNYSIAHLVVGDGSTAANGPSYSTGGGYGGLIHTVTGRIQLKEIYIRNGSFYANPSGGSNHNGLLFHNGHNALIELEDYQIADQGMGVKADSINFAANNAKVSVTGVTAKFGEVVGSNMGDNKDRRNYTNGGIVNIIGPAFQNDFIAYSSHLFNKDAGSNNTRYYYNLFGTSLAGEASFLPENRKLNGADLVIADADQMMIWHLSQYINDSLRRYLKPYFVGEAVPAKNTGVTIRGTIDLNHKGYYPTPVGNCTVRTENAATIIFHGDKLTDINGWLTEKGSEGEGNRRENYMMHSGLLVSPGGGVTVQGNEDYLTLQGKITRLHEDSGALFVMSVSGSNTICKIRLKDLYMNGFGGAAHGYGLLIGTIEDNTDMNISWLETEGYNDNSRQKYAASALIGRVGNTSAKNLKLDFTNIRVGGKNPDRNPANKSEGVFRWAILIDKHEFTDNTQENKGRVRYLFTEEAYKGLDMSATGNSTKAPFEGGIFGDNNYGSTGAYVTIGSELKNGVEYWNKDGEADLDYKGAIAWNDYLPYVCTNHTENKHIQVNPKNVSVDMGCGTYEDPYQITSAKQLLALSYYLINGNNQEYLKEWQIRTPGSTESLDGNEICTKNHTEATLKTYGDADFPTREELRKAYYMIMDDIDFSALKSSGDAAVVQSFVGLGTMDYPFSGVIVGKENVADGSVPTIILPHKRRGNTCDYFGLIQYAKGAVVKDIRIASAEKPQDGNGLLTNVVRVSNSGGAVMGCILGGDNMIDNVTVDVLLAVDAAPAEEGYRSNAAVGGYAGTVQQGSLILRGLSEDHLDGFQWGLLIGSDKDMEQKIPEIAKYPFVSGAVGRVENGFVIYEGSGTSANEKVLAHDAKHLPGIYDHGLLPFSNTYDVITASGMEGEKDKIPIIRSKEGNYTCDIANAAQLQIVSMAINSDAFSVYYDGGGYDKYASCRKAKYDEVGNVATKTTEFKAATEKDDDVYWYPYIYRYFSFGGTSAENRNEGGADGFYQTLESYGSDGGRKKWRSKLNAVTNAVSAEMTYQLNGGIDYDLSVYQRGFRGLGATYRVFNADGVTADMTPRNSVYSDFRANFDGKGATVRAEMINDYAKGIHTTALFNDLVNTDAVNSYSIKNLTITGIFKSSNSVEGVNSTNYAADRAAALVGMMRRPWEIENITVKNVDVWSKGQTAGIVAWINLPANTRTDPRAKNYSFTNCKVLSVKDGGADKGTVIHTLGGSSGGIVGTMSTWHENDLDGYTLSLDGCKVLGEEKDGNPYYVYIENEGSRTGLAGDDQAGWARGRSGGMAGHVGKHHQPNDNIRTRINFRVTDGVGTDADVQYVWVDGSDSTGGIVGEYYGFWQKEDDPCITVANITVSDSMIESKNRNEITYGSFGTGGIIGKLHREATCEIKDTNVINTNIRSVYGNMENGADRNNAPKGDLNAGGMIGYCYYKSRVSITNAKVQGDMLDGKPQYEISSRLSNAGGMIGACWDGEAAAEASKYITIENAKISGMNIVSDSRSRADKAADKASGISTGAAGGIAGRASAIEAFTVREASVENCVVRSGQGAAGGIIGNAVGQLDSQLENVSVLSCKIGSNGDLSGIGDSAGMGGIYGRIRVLNDRGSQKIKGLLQVEQCDIYGKNTGGIAGIADDKQQIGNIWSDKSTGNRISIQDNRILGYYAGGAFGTDRSKKTCFSDVLIEGNMIAAIGSGSVESAAGGFAGRKENSSDAQDSHNLNEVSIAENQIFSCHRNDIKKQSAGGVFGYLGLTKEIYSYQAAVKDNAIGFCDVANNNTVKQIFSDGIAGQMNAMDAAMAEIQGQDAKLWNGSGFGELPLNLKEEEIGEYSLYYGNLVGTYDGDGHAYFLRPEVDYTDSAATRPAVDTGSREAAAEEGNTLLSSPYNYRRNIHVIYFEPDNSANNTAAELWKNTREGGAGADNLFSQVNADAVLEAYRKVMGGVSVGSKELLDAYRLNIVNESGRNVSDIYENSYKNKDGYLSRVAIVDNGVEVNLPMIVLDTQYGTVDQLMGGVLAALTGAGGVHNSGTENKDSVYDEGMNEIIGISVKPMKVENGAVQDGDAGRKESIKYHNKENGHDRVELSYNNYDEEDENGKGTTFSMITITYRQKDYTAVDGGRVDGKTIELKIPAFVVERLTIDTYLKMVEGEVYNADKAKAEGTDKNPLLANDSTYTLYMEYIYGSARDTYSNDDEPICINKVFGITYMDEMGNAVPAKLWPGTRLTLIDVCDSNKVYYYTVQEQDTAIRFEQFQVDPEDPGSESYKNKPIHGEKGMDIYKDGDGFPAEDREEPYTDVAVERFLIVVDTTLVDEELKLTTRNVRDYHITPELDGDTAKRSTLTEHSKLQVTMQPGLTLGFVSKGEAGITDIAGIIQDGGEVEIDATFEIMPKRKNEKGEWEVDRTYWLRALNSNTTTIDSANHNKYLEIGIYLTDINGNRVRLPDNTNVTVNGSRVQPWEEEIKEEENLGAYVNRTEVYFYKDGKIIFPLDKLKEIVQKDMDINGEINFSGIVSEKLSVVLNFANADLSAYTENRYVVNLELLRIEDADYPAGGEVLDIYEKSLIARRQTELACALETKDLMELGINTYHNQTPMPHLVNFDFKLDFNGILSDTNQSMNQQIAEKYYTVTYHILEKTNQNGTPEYKPYTGNQLSLELVSPPASDMQKGLQKGNSSVGDFKNSVYITYKYSLKEIEKGTGGIGRGVIIRDLVLTVKDGSKMNLSNYKIMASVMVSDDPPGDIEVEMNPTLSDFFVFTIAKLKTDLDY